MTVRIVRADGREEKVTGITEIHWNFPSPARSLSPRVAFESDVNRTGFTVLISDIKEFEAIDE